MDCLIVPGILWEPKPASLRVLAYRAGIPGKQVNSFVGGNARLIIAHLESEQIIPGLPQAGIAEVIARVESNELSDVGRRDFQLEHRPCPKQIGRASCRERV